MSTLLFFCARDRNCIIFVCLTKILANIYANSAKVIHFAIKIAELFFHATNFEPQIVIPNNTSVVIPACVNAAVVSL